MNYNVPLDSRSIAWGEWRYYTCIKFSDYLKKKYAENISMVMSGRCNSCEQLHKINFTSYKYICIKYHKMHLLTCDTRE